MDKIVCISDTHGKHKGLDLPDGDMLMHAGDFSSFGYKHEVESFTKWLIKNKHKYSKGIVFVAGNHDRSFDVKYSKEYGGEPGQKPEWITTIIKELSTEGIHYLENGSVQFDNGPLIWGSPTTPDFYPETWAFNMPRNEIGKIWSVIPKNTDIVITHGPPYGIGDYVPHSMMYVGCESLNAAINEIRPKLHVYGHIHPGHGIIGKYNTMYINAAMVNDWNILVNKPIEIDL